MERPLKTYDAGEVAVIFAGSPITGGADGDFVSIEQNEDGFTLAVGVDGEGARSKSNNRSSRVTLTLLATSAANAVLSALYNTDIRTANGDGIAPLLIKDNSGNSLYTADKAWIVKPPTAAFGREVGTREWVLETHDLINNTAGN